MHTVRVEHDHNMHVSMSHTYLISKVIQPYQLYLTIAFIQE